MLNFPIREIMFPGVDRVKLQLQRGTAVMLKFLAVAEEEGEEEV
jgi:hypothetical protein